VSAVRVLRFVKRAQELGFTLTEVEGLLALADGGPRSCERARMLAQSQLDELNRKIADLRRMRASLGQLIATCEHPPADRSCPLVEAIAADDPLAG
jgi:DNA-binding transcriptional MerR regulator